MSLSVAASGEEARAPSPSWQEDALGFLMAPVGREEFIERFYEQRPLLNIRGEPERYSDLLTLAMLDDFIASADLREGMIELTNRKDPVAREDYTYEDGRIIRTAVAREYLRGATIILPHLHESLFQLGEFARSLEEIFSCHVQTNIYLTPSGNQGFPPHYDNHDVFILQIAGAKAWRLYDTPVQTPYRGERFQLERHKPSEVKQEFTLRAGDCVYIPRGLMHDAENVGDEPSLHITVGLITKTWADLLLEAVSELALSEPGFRRSLPPGFATREFDREQARRHFAALVQAVAEKASMDSAFDLMADNFIRGRRPNVAGVIMQHPPVPQPGDRFRRRRFVPWNPAEDEGDLVIVGPDGDLRFAQEDGDALERALSGAPFGQEDLACDNPAEMIRRLWAHGYLEKIA
ncbi:MAG: cupin domain-containing protein [Pseudomonadota bacterium]|nr:cupin domain-containing protein [Pseudomonadota bacterium]